MASKIHSSYLPTVLHVIGTRNIFKKINIVRCDMLKHRLIEILVRKITFILILGCRLYLSLRNAALLVPALIIKLTRKLNGEIRGVEIGERGFERIVLCFGITDYRNHLDITVSPAIAILNFEKL